MKKLSLIFTTLLFIVSSCAPQPISTSPPIAETLLPIPTLTAIPLPDILPVEWASNENGVVIPQKMYPLVGAIDKKHRRTIDLDYAGLRIAIVLGEGVDLQNPKVVVNQRDIRSFYAGELNKQVALKQQLEQVRATLEAQGTMQNSVVIVEGQDWPSDLLVSPPDGYVSQVVEFGKIESDEIRARYVLENSTLRQLSKEDEPNLLPALKTEGAYIKRGDTNKLIFLKGLDIVVFWADQNEGRFQYIYDTGLKDVIDQKWNINYFEVYLDSKWMTDSRLHDLDRLISLAEQNGIYVALVSGSTNGVGNASGEGQEMVDLMSKLADRYIHENHIIYQTGPEGFANPLTLEEREYAWLLWIDNNRKIAEAVRARNPNALIGMGSATYWGRDLSWFIDHPFEINGSRNNIFYIVDDYGDPDNSATNPRYPDQLPPYPRDLPEAMALLKAYAQKLVDNNIGPVMFGDVGGVSAGDNPHLNQPEDLKYMIDVFNFINQSPGRFHHSFWFLGYDVAEEFGVFDGNGNPTERGYLLFYNFTGQFHPDTPDWIRELINNKMKPVILPTDFLN